MQLKPEQTNRSSTVLWYFPLLRCKWVFSGPRYVEDNLSSIHRTIVLFWFEFGRNFAKQEATPPTRRVQSSKRVTMFAKKKFYYVCLRKFLKTSLGNFLLEIFLKKLSETFNFSNSYDNVDGGIKHSRSSVKDQLLHLLQTWRLIITFINNAR